MLPNASVCFPTGPWLRLPPVDSVAPNSSCRRRNMTTSRAAQGQGKPGTILYHSGSSWLMMVVNDGG